MIPLCLTLNALAGLAGLPEVVMPLVNKDGAPIGLGWVAASGQDAALLQAAAELGGFGGWIKP